MKIQFFLPVFLINAAIAIAAERQEAASFPDKQITGVGVSTRSGRIFVNFPNWSDDRSISVAEIVNGQPKTFPTDEWNKAGPASSHFICVQSVVVDTRTNTAFITESANGAIIVVDLKSGKARRLLDGHPSTQPEKDVKLVVDGKALIDQQKKMSGRRLRPMGCSKGTMVAFILPILNTAQSCVGTPPAGGSSKLLRTNVCSGNDIDHNRWEHNPKASAFERNFMRIRSDHGCDVTTAATRVAFFKFILSLDACCHAPT